MRVGSPLAAPPPVIEPGKKARVIESGPDVWGINGTIVTVLDHRLNTELRTAVRIPAPSQLGIVILPRKDLEAVE